MTNPDMTVRIVGENPDAEVAVVGGQVIETTPADVGKVVSVDGAGALGLETRAALAADPAFAGVLLAFGPAPSGDATGASDRVAIAAALTALAPGGRLLLHAGEYIVNMAGVTGFAGYYAGVVVPSGVTVCGAGRGATTVKLAASEAHTAATEGASIIYNADLDGSGDTDIAIQDLTVDGNAANQTTVHHGITMIRTRGSRFTRVTVKNVRGTASSGASETFHFETQLGMDTTYTDCTVVGDAGSTASGFSADNATGVHYSNCIAYGMTVSMGFTHNACEEVHHSNCHAYLNGVNGFNSEESRNVSYVGCHAGGEVAAGTTPWPLSGGTTLGNTAAGFVINGTKSAVLTGCTSRKNATGIGLVEGTAGASGRIVGCAITDNTTVGVAAATAATLLRWHIEATEVLNNNSGTTEYDLPTGWTDGPGVQLPTPTVPATTVAFTNPYPFAVTVYIVTAGTMTAIKVNAADIDITTKTIRLLPAMTIAFTYSAAPTWLWFGG